MDYIDENRKTTMVDLLGKNKNDRNIFKLENIIPNHLMFQAFKRAGEVFKYIDNDTISVIVPYKNDKLLEQLESAIYKNEYKKIEILLKKLQRYSVSLYQIQS